MAARLAAGLGEVVPAVGAVMDRRCGDAVSKKCLTKSFIHDILYPGYSKFLHGWTFRATAGVFAGRFLFAEGSLPSQNRQNLLSICK